MEIAPPRRVSRTYTQRLEAPPEVTGPPDGEAVWVITDYEPPARIAFLKVTPRETVGWITIVLRPDGATHTLADVTYAYTALGDRGRELVDGYTAEHYAGFMEEWEAALNRFLRGSEGPRRDVEPQASGAGAYRT